MPVGELVVTRLARNAICPEALITGTMTESKMYMLPSGAVVEPELIRITGGDAVWAATGPSRKNKGPASRVASALKHRIWEITIVASSQVGIHGEPSI